jgi:hypothetical protein
MAGLPEKRRGGLKFARCHKPPLLAGALEPEPRVALSSHPPQSELLPHQNRVPEPKCRALLHLHYPLESPGRPGFLREFRPDFQEPRPSGGRPVLFG